MLWLHIPDWFSFVIGCLATFRLTSIIQREKIAAPFRRLFGVIEGEGDTFYFVRDEYTIIYPDNFFGHLLECFWCVSVWVGLFVTLYICLLPEFPFLLLLLPFAFSAVAMLLRELSG